MTENLNGLNNHSHRDSRKQITLLGCLTFLFVILSSQGFLTAKPVKTTKPKTPPSRINEDYSRKIREYTTESYFLTELIDHLPASDKVPSPDKVLGYVIGTPGKLTYTKDIYRYFRELEKSTPRVRIFSAPEKSEGGREQMLVLVSDEQNLKQLDSYKKMTARLADPRNLNESEAKQIIAQSKPFYWASGSIHSPETGSPEMLMELAYRLAVSNEPVIEEIRRNMIVIITPALEVDGRDRMVDLYNYRKANPDKDVPSLLYWGKYVAHDNNRDGLGMALALTRNQMKTFLEYHPQVLHDLHESIPFLYTSTGTGPYNAWLDPIVINEWQLLAYHEIDEMTKRGVPGVWTHGFYDGWAPNYMFYIANGHNSIGRFYETFGNGGADTMNRITGTQSQRDWFRPNPPLPRVKWSMRNNINMQQSGIILAMNFVAQNRDRFLYNFYLKGVRAINKVNTEGPAGYVIPADNTRPVEVAETVNLMRLMGIEVHTATSDIQIKNQKFPAGSYVIRMDQPYSRMADMLMDRQFYKASDPTPYDDTGWTIGAMRNIKIVRVTEKEILNAPMTLLTSDAKVIGKITGTGTIYVINHNTDNTLATLRFRLNDLKISAAEEQFKIDNQTFSAGSFIINATDNTSNLKERLETTLRELGLTAVAVDKLPEIKTHELAVPRIAILHTWVNTQNEGWFRIEFDRLQIPYTYISDHVIRNTENLREKFDVIIFPPVGGSAQSIVNGFPKYGEPVPWQKSDLTPNMGGSPDETSNIRGGMELRGIMNLQKFVEDGGVFVPIAGTSTIPISYGITRNINIVEPRALQARGSIFNATVSDKKSPITYGYEESFPIYFNQGPLFQIAPLVPQAFGGGAQGTGSRSSGRGSPIDPDIIQAMPQAAPQPKKEEIESSSSDAEQEPMDDLMRQSTRAFTLPPNLRPRVVLKFASEEKNLLVSGMLAGGSELVNKPAVVDVPVGKGHVVFFATNPMWRHQTQGEFFLLFNTALNFNHLGSGISPPAASKPAP